MAFMCPLGRELSVGPQSCCFFFFFLMHLSSACIENRPLGAKGVMLDDYVVIAT